MKHPVIRFENQTNPIRALHWAGLLGWILASRALQRQRVDVGKQRIKEIFPTPPRLVVHKKDVPRGDPPLLRRGS